MSEMIECKTCGIKWNIELAAECPSCANRNPSAPVNQSKSITYYDLPDPAVEQAAPRSDNSDQLNAIYSNKAPDVSSSMSPAVNSEVTLNDLADLLQASISASNRINHAIRALVRFFMVQLVFLTLAYFLNSMAQAGIDPYECTYSGDSCDANPVFSFLAFVAVVLGVVLSSRIAWAELEHSNIRGVHSGRYFSF
jgi:hypothetical protein